MEYNVYDRISDNNTKRAVYDLWRECFGDTPSYTDFYFKWKMKDNQVLVAYKGNRLSSMLHLNPYIVNIGDKRVSLNYIVGVATKEEDRRQGLMKLLLEKAINQMNEEHMPFTYLMPAKEAIYLPFGFRIVYEQESYKQLILNGMDNIVRDGLDIVRQYKADTLDLIPSDTKNIERVVEFTNQLLKNSYDIFVCRNSYYYERLINEMYSSKGEVKLILLNETIIGYIAYMKENDLAVAEAIYLPEKKEVFWNVVADKLGEFIIDRETKSSTPTIMARIINLNEFMKGLTARVETSLVISVQDAIIKENNGIYEVIFKENESECKPSTKTPELEGDISEFTKLFFGDMKKEELTQTFQAIEIDIIMEKLNKINCYKNVFINDVV